MKCNSWIRSKPNILMYKCSKKKNLVCRSRFIFILRSCTKTNHVEPTKALKSALGPYILVTVKENKKVICYKKKTNYNYSLVHNRKFKMWDVHVHVHMYTISWSLRRTYHVNFGFNFRNSFCDIYYACLYINLILCVYMNKVYIICRRNCSPRAREIRVDGP